MISFFLGVLLQFVLTLKSNEYKKNEKISNSVNSLVIDKNNNKHLNSNISIDILSNSISTKKKMKLTLLHFSCCFLSTVLMFIMMTYNFWLILIILAGNITGYFLFALNWKIYEFRSSDENCICHCS